MNFIKLPRLLLLFIPMIAVSTESMAQSKSKAIPVIFETDMGNDIDDALALDMLYKYQDQGKIKLLALNSNKNSPYTVPFMDVLNQWYGYGKIPIGTVKNGANSEGDAVNFAEKTMKYELDGVRPFKSSKTMDAAIDAVELYRKLLSKQADGSVVIASVGFSTNLAKLLETKGDKYSKLSGKELVAKKVKFLSMMAGNFYTDTTKRFVEYNVAKDVPAARAVFANWPTKIIVSPYEVGDEIKYPGSSIQHDFTSLKPHPMVVAYEAYLPMPYDRATWDLTSVLYAVEGNTKGYFSESKPGKVEVVANGKTYFTEGKGDHIVLGVNQQQKEMIAKRFVELITIKPKNRK